MAEIPLPEDFSSVIREIEHRLRALETRPTLPARAVYASTQNITNTSWATLLAGPSVTATIGPSQMAVVTVVCDMGLNQTNQTGYLGFYDGTTFRFAGWMSITSATSDAFTAGTIGVPRLVTGLPTGQVTFYAAGFVSTGNVNYSNVEITVQPC